MLTKPGRVLILDSESIWDRLHGLDARITATYAELYYNTQHPVYCSRLLFVRLNNIKSNKSVSRALNLWMGPSRSASQTRYASHASNLHRLLRVQVVSLLGIARRHCAFFVAVDLHGYYVLEQLTMHISLISQTVLAAYRLGCLGGVVVALCH